MTSLAYAACTGDAPSDGLPAFAGSGELAYMRQVCAGLRPRHRMSGADIYGCFTVLSHMVYFEFSAVDRSHVSGSGIQAPDICLNYALPDSLHIVRQRKQAEVVHLPGAGQRNLCLL